MGIDIRVNNNFHTSTGRSVFSNRLQDPDFAEYRRQWHEYPSSFTVAPFPLHLDIESSAVCNLRCPFCAATLQNWGQDRKGLMDMELFKRVIDEGRAAGLLSIKLSLRGEPMLHPELPQMIAYAMDQGILDCYFNTNGTLLSETRIHQLIEAGLPRISISFEGTDPEVYERHRVGADFAQVRENILRLRAIRDRLGVDYPQIRIQTVLTEELKPGYPDYVRFWEEIADEVGYLDARDEGPQHDHTGSEAPWACPFLWQRMVVLWDGTLLPCLMHGVADFRLMTLGNVQEISIQEQWQGEKCQHWRALHQAGRSHEIAACDRCSYRAMEIRKIAGQ